MIEPDLKKTNENLRDAGWKMRFHKKNHDVTESVFQNELQQSDLHIHAGHGFNLPFIGGHIELSDYLYSQCSSRERRMGICKRSKRSMEDKITKTMDSNSFMPAY